MNKLKLLLFAALLTLGGLALTACDEPGPAEQAGQEIDEAVEEARDAVEDVGDEIEDAAEDLEDEID